MQVVELHHVELAELATRRLQFSDAPEIVGLEQSHDLRGAPLLAGGHAQVAFLALLARDADSLAGEPSLAVRVDLVHGGDLRPVATRREARRRCTRSITPTP